eukprot:SAG31_NODE_5008_length_2805_cov_65.548041_2_plen_405_part_00
MTRLDAAAGAELESSVCIVAALATVSARRSRHGWPRAAALGQWVGLQASVTPLLVVRSRLAPPSCARPCCRNRCCVQWSARTLPLFENCCANSFAALSRSRPPSGPNPSAHQVASPPAAGKGVVCARCRVRAAEALCGGRTPGPSGARRSKPGSDANRRCCGWGSGAAAGRTGGVIGHALLHCSASRCAPFLYHCCRNRCCVQWSARTLPRFANCCANSFAALSRSRPPSGPNPSAHQVASPPAAGKGVVCARCRVRAAEALCGGRTTGPSGARRSKLGSAANRRCCGWGSGAAAGRTGGVIGHALLHCSASRCAPFLYHCCRNRCCVQWSARTLPRFANCCANSFAALSRSRPPSGPGPSAQQVASSRVAGKGVVCARCRVRAAEALCGGRTTGPSGARRSTV